MVTRDKVRGMIIGGAIGDAYGMPVETWTPQRIFELYPEGLDHYHPPTHHKWFNPEKMPAGTTTDDTQLTLATAKGVLACSPTETNFNAFMDFQAISHIVAYKDSTAGWGKSTTEAVRRLSNCVHWSRSGKTSERHRGTGNGVVMKCAPLALLLERGTIEKFNQALVTYCAMTHYNEISALATIVHTHAVNYCFWDMEQELFQSGFIRHITEHIHHWWCKPNDKMGFEFGDLEYCDDDLLGRLNFLHDVPDDIESIRRMYGNGSCYVYDSLPFSYALFLKNPFSVSTLRTVVEAGGDTDTNAKMVGEMIGINCGYEAFLTKENRWMIEGLAQHDELLSIADRLFEWTTA